MMANLYEQLLAMAASAAEHGHTSYNPKPSGLPWPGSGTDQVLQLLRSIQPVSLPYSEIRKRTGLGRGCIAWALRYLEQVGKIEVVQVKHVRGPGHTQRYRAKKL